jgi:large subunit ribosomal protein L22
VIKSAVANAGFDVDAKELMVASCQVDDGPRLKRWQPVMRGSAHPIIKRMCHIHVELERIEEQ